MKKILSILLLIASPTLAANWNQDCDSQVLAVDACRADQVGQGGVFFGFWMTTAEAVRVRDVLGLKFGYRDMVFCSQERVDDGQCVVGDIGTQIPNPEGKRDYVDRRLRQKIREFTQSKEVNDQVDALTRDPLEIDGKVDSDDEGPELDG